MIKAFLVTLLMLPALLQAEERDIAYEKINTFLNVDTQSPLLEVKLAVDICVSKPVELAKPEAQIIMDWFFMGLVSPAEEE